MQLTAAEQTQALFAMVLYGLVATAGIGLLIAATVNNVL
jgi:hypothetical protein